MAVGKLPKLVKKIMLMEFSVRPVGPSTSLIYELVSIGNRSRHKNWRIFKEPVKPDGPIGIL